MHVIEGSLYEMLHHYDGKSESSGQLHVVMEKLQCCGIEGPEDFETKYFTRIFLKKWHAHEVFTLFGA